MYRNGHLLHTGLKLQLSLASSRQNRKRLEGLTEAEEATKEHDPAPACAMTVLWYSEGRGISNSKKKKIQDCNSLLRSSTLGWLLQSEDFEKHSEESVCKLTNTSVSKETEKKHTVGFMTPLCAIEFEMRATPPKQMEFPRQERISSWWRETVWRVTGSSKSPQAWPHNSTLTSIFYFYTHYLYHAIDSCLFNWTSDVWVSDSPHLSCVHLSLSIIM